MVTNSFSHLLPNLFIGLCKGSRLLRPYSIQFKNDLGYAIFKFEPSFKISAGGRANPDVIIISQKVANTLLVEWTQETVIHERKKDQIERYSRIGATDLTDILAIPPSTVNTYNTTLIIQSTALESFKVFLGDRDWRFPILIFNTQESAYLLKKVENDFDEKKTDKFFTSGVEVQRIPLHYLPFSLDQISLANIVTFVIRHLISLLVKGTREISIEVFCAGYIPVWRFIDISKRNELLKTTKEVLNALVRKSIGKELLTRIGDNPPKWKLMEIAQVRKKIRFVRNSLNQFIAEIEDKPHQEELKLE